MKTPSVGRNDPCPCGSGKKFKRCCLGQQESARSGNGAAGASADLRQAMEGMHFGSMDDVHTLLERHTRQQNQNPLDDFHGLSPEHMYRMHYFPFASPEFVRFPEVLDTGPAAPVLTLFGLLAEAIGEKGLKPTAKGNLPRKFCREAALAYWGEDGYREKTRHGGINSEEDFMDLHITRLTAELPGLVRKYKGRFILSRDCRARLAGKGMAALYPRMFRAYVKEYNWAYWDCHPELRFIQTACLFTLYLLTRYGDTWRPHEFYEDCFLRAFPMLLDEIPDDHYFTPEDAVRSCYTWRTLVHFVGFLGLAAVESVSDKRFPQEYRVKALPLLHQTVLFDVTGK